MGGLTPKEQHNDAHLSALNNEEVIVNADTS